MRKLVTWKLAAATAVAGLIAATPAAALVKKFMTMCEGNKLCPSYELALTPPDGWTIDANATKEHKMQFLVPQGKNFRDAPALIYVRTSLLAKDNNVENFVKVSQDRWKQSVKDTRITQLAPVARKNGKPAFVRYAYENPSRPTQAYEVVSFGEDDDGEGNKFVLMVVTTGGGKGAIDGADKALQAFLSSH